jgi:hypothetical protein
VDDGVARDVALHPVIPRNRGGILAEVVDDDEDVFRPAPGGGRTRGREQEKEGPGCFFPAI